MRTRVLVVSESPFLNFDTSFYCYELIKLLVKKGMDVYDLITNTVVDSKYDFIKGDFDSLSKFHSDKDSLNESDKELFSKVIYIYKCKYGNVDNKFIENLVTEHNISFVICCISITSNFRLDKKISIPLIMNIRIEYAPLTKIHYDLIKFADILISNTNHGDISIKQLDNEENKIIYKINPKIDFAYLDEVIHTREDIRKEFRRRLNIGSDWTVFLLDFSSINTTDMERKCIDTSINLFMRYFRKNKKSFLIINSIVDESLKIIIDIENIPKENYAVINDFYQKSPIKLRNLRPQLYMTADIMIGLSGGEDYSLSVLEAQYVGLPVLFNNISFSNEGKYLGEINEHVQDIYLASDVQTYIKMPKVKNCLDKLYYMINNLETYKVTNEINSIMKENYGNDFETKWRTLLRGF